MTKIIMIGYWSMLMFSYGCECTMNPKLWPFFWCWDQTFGGGLLLWFIAFKYSRKYRFPAFLTFCFACVRMLWNVYCYSNKIDPANTWWTVWLAILLVPVIYHTLFVPKGVTVFFLNKHLKRIGA